MPKEPVSDNDGNMTYCGSANNQDSVTVVRLTQYRGECDDIWKAPRSLKGHKKPPKARESRVSLPSNLSYVKRSETSRYLFAPALHALPMEPKAPLYNF